MDEGRGINSLSGSGPPSKQSPLTFVGPVNYVKVSLECSSFSPVRVLRSEINRNRYQILPCLHPIIH